MMRLAEPSTALPGPKSPSLGSYRLAYSTPVLPWAELAQTNSRVLLAGRVLHRQALTLPRLVAVGGFMLPIPTADFNAGPLDCVPSRSLQQFISPYQGSAL